MTIKKELVKFKNATHNLEPNSDLVTSINWHYKDDSFQIH